tara:strand:+ start:3080 stop:3709 length:630 start_codon:yes stop_codon:yes gene_type:complete
MRLSLLIIGSKNFNNSFNEIKEYFGFELIFLNLDKLEINEETKINAIIVDSKLCENQIYLDLIKKMSSKPLLLLDSSNKLINCNYYEKILLPINFFELKNKIINVVTIHEFNKNSTVQIKNYTLDKNEKKLKKEKLSITITEREVQLIELLNNKKKPLTKNYILKEIWNYSADADTHTVETHIYRLRKKILRKFTDDKFILNTKHGYFI